MTTMARGEIGLEVWVRLLDETRRGLVGRSKRTDGSFSKEASDTIESSRSDSGSIDTGLDGSLVAVEEEAGNGTSLWEEAVCRGLVWSKRMDGSFSKDASESSDSVSLVFVGVI